MSLKGELLTPLRDIGEAGQSLMDGSRVLVRYAWRGAHCGLRLVWRSATRGESASDRADSVGNAVLAGLVVLAVAGTMVGSLAYLVRPYLRWVAAGLAVLWVVAAWVAAPLQAAATTPNDHEKSAGEKPPGPDPHHGARAIVRAVITTVAQAETDGYKGVHLAELLDQLRADNLTRADDVTQFRAWLDEAGIPYNRNLKRGGKGPTWGVRVDELTAALGRPLRDALLALDQTPAPAAAEAPAPAVLEVPSQAPADAEKEPLPRAHLTPVPAPSPEAAA